MDFITLLFKTVVFRPYVFVFLIAFLLCAQRLIGWRRTGLFFLVTWVTAFVCEFSSTRTGIPFGWYHYTLSTIDQELYLSNVPFMDSLSFTFLLYASYCMALAFLLPALPQSSPSGQPRRTGTLIELQFDRISRTSGPVLGLATLLFAFIDMVIDPVALLGDRWFLGLIYYYPDPGHHFGVPVANYVGWGVVGLISLAGYFSLDRRLTVASVDRRGWSVTGNVLLACGLYYGVLIFNLGVTFWIDEPLLGMTGLLMYIPITVLLLLRLWGWLPLPQPEEPS
jgi:putative membrane protein